MKNIPLKAALCVVALAATFLPSSAQETISTESIVDALTAKPKTRSIMDAGPELSAEDKAFIQSLGASTRGITVVEREKIMAVVETAALPTIDLEIFFDFDSALIGPNAEPDLAKLGQALTSERLKGQAFMLGGHTDAKGSEDYNQVLSEKRALAVRHYLLENHGIPNGRLVVAGFGEEKLKNTLDTGARENRRVQIVRLSP